MENWMLITLIVLVLLTAVALLFWAFYHQPSKDIAYVRTGLFGEKIIVNEGGLVLPVVHAIMPVNRKTIRVEIERDNKAGLITKDSLRVDVIAEVSLRVAPEDEAIATAARTLGKRTMDTESMKEFLEAQCVSGLRSVAASMDLEELHRNRTQFEHSVRDGLESEFNKNGLELVMVALKRLDQTDKEYFDPTNTFDALGLIKLDKISEDSKKKRNDIEQENAVAIQKRNKEAAEQKLTIEQQEVEAQKNQEKYIAELHARTAREIDQIKFSNEVAVDQAKRDMELQQAEFKKATLEAWMVTDDVETQATKITEQIATAREEAEAQRNKLIEVISAEKEAKRQTIIAQANSEVEKLAAKAAEIRYMVEAAGKSALNKAANLLENDQINMQVKMEIVRQLPQIISESVKPIENIDGIKIMHLDGLANAAGGGSGSGGNGTVASGSSGGGGDSLADQVVNSALRYRAQSPLVESLLNEVGLKGSGINDFTKQLQEDMQTKAGSESPKLDSSDHGADVKDDEPPTDTKH